MIRLVSYAAFVLLVLYSGKINAYAQGEHIFSNSLLWEIRHPKYTDQPSFLFGTMHLICKEDYIWTDSMQYYFDKSEHIYFELNLSDPQLMTDAAGAFMDLSGKEFKDYFHDSNDYNLFAQYLNDSLGQDIRSFQNLKPVGVYMLLGMNMGNDNCEEMVSYELRLSEQAEEKNKSIAGLETLQDQVRLLTSIPEDSLIQQMVDMAKGKKQEETDIRALINLYRSQNINRIDSLIRSNLQSGFFSMNNFVDQRNSQWTHKISSYMQKRGNFFAVGAGHIYGLLFLLQKEGYLLKPIH